MADVPDRANDSRRSPHTPLSKTAMKTWENETVYGDETPKMTAKCGHEDALGYFSGTVCGKCARKAHKKAMGK
jgi:hypothetical protein